MSNGYPKYSKSAQSGELGVNIVNEVVTENLGWIFKRNHQESDFGIDGYIEVVSEDGYVTGKCLQFRLSVVALFSPKKTAGVTFTEEKINTLITFLIAPYLSLFSYAILLKEKFTASALTL